MLFQNKDGEIRIYEHGRGGLGGAARPNSGVTHYFEILFIDANLSGPIARAQTEERLVLNRGVLDSNAHYVESDDTARLEPLALTFSCRSADTKNMQMLLNILSGVTEVIGVGGTTYPIHTRKGKGSAIYGLSTSLPQFSGTTGSIYKIAYKVEVLYSGTSDWGLRWDEVYFPPAEQTIVEAEDSLTINLNAQVFGGVTTITSFHSDIASGDTVTAMT